MFNTILENFHLEKLLWIIKSKFKYMLAIGLMLSLLAGVAANYMGKSTYMAQISFYVYTNPDYITESGVNLNSSEISQAKTLLDSYLQILRSTTFLEKVKEEIDYEYKVEYLRSSISAEAVENTAVFRVYVFDEDPVAAMEIANAIGKLAPDEIIRIVKSGGIEVLDPAQLPTVPYSSTSVIKMALIGGVAGFVLSACIFLLIGLLNTTIRRKYEIEDRFRIPIIGTIPLMVGDKKGEQPDVILREESVFFLKESYSNIRASLLFIGKGERCPIYGITSADVNEGKSLNSINLAISYAQMGKKVLLIDADMRKSEMRDLLGVSYGAGLSEYLACITEDVRIVKKEKNLDILLAGIVPPNPAELLACDRWKDLLKKSKEEYDIIFIDLPPVGVVADALIIAEDVTAFILVVREGITRFEREEMIVRNLEGVDADICGFIYNGISENSPDYNYKQYGKEYAD